MNFTQKLRYVFKKYPSLRFVSLLVLIFIVFFSLVFFSRGIQKAPHLYGISPQIANPGDVFTLTGQFFGSEQNDSYVEIGGNPLTQSSYLEWSENSIRLTLPANIQDGLVYVVTKAGRSEPKNFANRQSIPILIKKESALHTPRISSVSEKKPAVGNLISIQGANFSSLRGSSKVYFSLSDTEDDITEYIACSETNPDYDFWSDELIRLRVPDGAQSGNIYVETDTGKSNFFPIQINTKVGTKTHKNKNTYLLSLHGDMTDIETMGESTLTLRIPRPIYSPLQELIEITQSKPEPTIADHMGTIVHQFPISKGITEKIEVNHNFVVLARSLETQIAEKEILPYSDKSLSMYAEYLKPNSLIVSDKAEIQELAKKITKGTTNVYTKARRIFDYIKEKFTLDVELRENERNLQFALELKTLDSYEAALLFTSLCRAAEIICLPVAGVLIDANLIAKNHWWTEIYLENFGWLPVDMSLALGLEYQGFHINEKKDADFYFGNIDSQHIAFSRGLNTIKPTNQTGKIVTRNRSYALQTIWEEASAQILSYSSFWSPIYVNGVY
ncbi:MAG TPA: transglutaminase domain-containing protein [Treponemataceae bacterium]|nr:transglutaminase domain-containing protein [Treponemataceae bacterium]